MGAFGIQKPQPRFDGADSASRFKTLVPCTSSDHQHNRSPAENRFTKAHFTRTQPTRTKKRQPRSHRENRGVLSHPQTNNLNKLMHKSSKYGVSLNGMQ